MLKKEKIKLFLTIFLTPIIIIWAIIISITTREKPILERKYTENYTQRELLDVIDHTHSVK